MSTKIKIRFYALLSFLFIVSMYAGWGTISAGCGGASTGGSASVDGGSADPLTAVETSLYESGTYDFPVTIAKLDSPTLELVTLTVDAVSTESISANLVRYAETDPGYVCTFTFGSGAVDSSATPYAVAFDATLDTSNICLLNDDGSGTCAIDCDLGDTVAVAALNSAQDQASAFLSFSPTSVGTFAGEILRTNTDAMDGALEKYVDAEGMTYISLDNSDGTWVLARLDPVGTVETLSDSLSSKPLVVTAASSPTDAGDIVIVLLTSGEIIKFEASVAASVGATPSLVDSSGQPLYTELSWTSTAIADIEEELDVDQFFTSVTYDLIGFNSTGTVLLAGGPDGAPNGVFLSMVDPSGAVTSYALASSENFLSARADLGESDILYAVTKGTSDAFFVLSRFTMPNSFDTDAWTTQWNSREILYSSSGDPVLGVPTVTVQSIDVSNTGDVAILVNGGSGGGQILAFRQENSYQLEEITDVSSSDVMPFSAQKWAPGGEFVVFCGASSGTNDVMAHIPAIHAEQEYMTLLDLGDALSCSTAGSLFVDENNLVHLYHTEGMTAAEAVAQEAVIDPRKNPAFDGIL